MGTLIDLVPLDYTDAVVAVGAAILGLAAGVLGTFAVQRQRSLVGDAVAHATLPGVAIAFLLTGAKDAGSLIVGAGLAGLAAALLMVALERAPRLRADAAIGVVLSAMFSLGIVLLTAIASGDNANQAGLERYLFGQAAGLLERDLVVMSALTAVGLLVVVVGFRALKAALFDPGHAASLGLPVRLVDVLVTVLLVVAVIVGVRAVGAILMVAMLVVPAVAARQLAGRLWQVLVLAGLIGMTVGVTGALISERSELPTGPVIVLVAVSVATLAILLAPGRGVLWRAVRLRSDRRRTTAEGVLVDLETALHAGPPPTRRELELAGGRPHRTLTRALRDLDRAGLLARDGDRLRLTESGAAAAHAALERRALWSVWLEHGWRLELPDAREPDPSDLRGSLGDEHVDELLALAR